MNAILGVRDTVGAIIQPVYLVTRTWTGTEPGAGTATDGLSQILPTPAMKSFDQDVRLREGGNIKSGDIILTSVSKQSYTQADLDSVTGSANIEKFYLVGTKLYQIIKVSERIVTFDVHLREMTNQTKY
jgi:hypothetical protein